MADTDDWATEKARELLYCICSGADPYAPTPACGCPEDFRDAVASALRDVRREAIEEAATHVEEHHYQDARLLARGLRALAADRKEE